MSLGPIVRRERSHWQRLARAIPDPELRRLALLAHRSGRGSVEAPAAYSMLASAPWRTTAIRAQIAFQTAYAYVDVLCTQPSIDPRANAAQLSRALLAAIDSVEPQSDYYAHHPQHEDGGYLSSIVGTCREALGRLPSCAVIGEGADGFARRISACQSQNLTEAQGGCAALQAWAQSETPLGSELRWWETAASASSCLGLFVLIGAAAHPVLSPHEAAAVEHAYWPWAGALQALLECLAEAPSDPAHSRNLLAHYASPQETAERMQTLTEESIRQFEQLESPQSHTLLLTGMAAQYLTSPHAQSDEAQLVTAGIRETIGHEPAFERETRIARGHARRG